MNFISEKEKQELLRHNRRKSAIRYQDLACFILKACQDLGTQDIQVDLSEILPYYNGKIPSNFKENPASFVNNFSYHVRKFINVDGVIVDNDSCKLFFFGVRPKEVVVEEKEKVI